MSARAPLSVVVINATLWRTHLTTNLMLLLEQYYL